MKRMICLLFALTLLLSACGKKPVPEYQTVAVVDGNCYVADGSGNVYQIDWETGEASRMFRAPMGIEWTADETLEHIYYTEYRKSDKMTSVICMDTESGKKETIYELRGIAVSRATSLEHYLLFVCDEWDKESSYYRLVALELETGEVQVLEESELDLSIRCGWENSVCVRVYDNVENSYTLHIWDVAAGTRTELDPGTGFLTGGGPEYCAVLGDRLYFKPYVGGYICRAALDGSDIERIEWQILREETDVDPYYALYPAGDWICVMAIDYEAEETVLYRYDGEETLTEVGRYDGVNGGRYMTSKFSTDGKRFAALPSVDGKRRLILGEF